MVRYVQSETERTVAWPHRRWILTRTVRSQKTNQTPISPTAEDPKCSEYNPTMKNPQRCHGVQGSSGIISSSVTNQTRRMDTCTPNIIPGVILSIIVDYVNVGWLTRAGSEVGIRKLRGCVNTTYKYLGRCFRKGQTRQETSLRTRPLQTPTVDKHLQCMRTIA